MDVRPAGSIPSRFDAAAARRYETWCASPLGRFVEEVEGRLVWALLAPQPGERIADLGCGTGTYALRLAAHGCRVVGVDESEAMLASARAKPAPAGHVHLMRGDVTALPFADGAFDAALLQVTLEFVGDPARALREAVRVLRPGGRLVVGLIHATGPWAAHYRDRGRREPRSVYRGARFWTVPEICRWLPPGRLWVLGGLYVGPQEFAAREQAWELEAERRAVRGIRDAGFVVLRWQSRQEHGAGAP